MDIHLDWNWNILTQENVFENVVCKIAAIRLQCVKSFKPFNQCQTIYSTCSACPSIMSSRSPSCQVVWLAHWPCHNGGVCRRKAGPHPGKGSLTPWGRKSDCGNSPVSPWKPAGQEITTGLLWKLITFCWSQQSESTKQWSDFEAIGFEIWSLFCWSAEKNGLHSVSFSPGMGKKFGVWISHVINFSVKSAFKGLTIYFIEWLRLIIDSDLRIKPIYCQTII